MNLTESIDDVISKTQENHCGNCQIGKALAELLRLRNTLQPSTAVQDEPAAPKSKLQKKTATYKKSLSAQKLGKSKVCNGCNLEWPIVNFPKNKTCAGGHAGTCRNCVRERVNQRAAAKKKQGMPIKQDANTKTPRPSDQEEPESSLECKFCHAPCASPERLERHMRVVHGKG